MNTVFEKFSYHCRKALLNAQAIAQEIQSQVVDIEHLFLGIMREKGSIGSEIIQRSKSSPSQESLQKKIPNHASSSPLQFSSLAKKTLEGAVLLAVKYRHQFIGTEHLLFSIINTQDPKILQLLKSEGIDENTLRNHLKMALKSASKLSSLSSTLNSMSLKNEEMILHRQYNQQTSTKKKLLLDYFATDLCSPKIQKRIDPVIGREAEIQRIIHILCRRIKNNPLLIGDPGVGKTAIVEGLAKKILQGDVPEQLLNKKIYSLDLGLLIAGSSFRGEFEQRLKQILYEVKQHPEIILFIDEIHNVVGAGSAGGSLDAANLLKPSLSRGEIKCIGATTPEEYKKYIENDAAFERRFQTVFIEEPSPQKAIHIITEVKNFYEKYHHVEITPQAIESAVHLSQRYLPDKFLPDKALDIIDEAAAGLRLKKFPNRITETLKKTEKAYCKMVSLKKKAVMNEDYDLALQYRKKEKSLLKQIIHLRQTAEKERRQIAGKITDEHIRHVIANITNLPQEEITRSETEKLLNLEKRLEKHIIGQQEAIVAVADTLRRSWAGVADRSRPIGSFLFLGPSGVGKTELAKTLAATLFDEPQSLIRIDMSEFAESLNLTKLIGSPAGYIGYKDTTSLTDKVKRRPFSVVLFDELEKAHPIVINLLLQILEDGHLTDASGKTVHFKNTILIMTSNLGSEEFHQFTGSWGFAEKKNSDTIYSEKQHEIIKQSVLKQVQKYFRPEFLNRIDNCIVFRPLGFRELKNIVRIHIEKLANRLKEEKGIKLSCSPSALTTLAKMSAVPHLGGRAVRKVILEHIENPIAKIILRNKCKKNIAIHARRKTIIIQ